jgi:CheY-like chemotaxis protein
MPEGGRLQLRLRNVRLGRDAQVADLQPGDYVQLSVVDEGCGMTAEVRERAFEPFFTTKRDGRGSGLGLSMVYGFVKQSGGHVTLQSEPDSGTSVVIHLPRCIEQEVAPHEVADGDIVGGEESILVVEDDPGVRATAVALLKELGYRVLEAHDGLSALAVLQSDESIDLLFTDVIMPGPLRCTELARQAEVLRPGLGVLFTSGYPENVIAHGGRLDPGVELLGKPYPRETLARMVRRMLDRRPRPARSDEPSASSPATVGGALQVLFVEDDPTLRMLTGEVIGELGHQVDACDSAEAALARLEQRRYDVLLTDVGLGGMSGIELVRRLGDRYPSMHVVIASGYPVRPRDEGLPDSTRVLLKPYDVQQVRALLDELSSAR